MDIKDKAASVLTRLKNQSKETGVNYQMCLQLFCQEEFLRRLAASRYSENLILKGGMFLYLLTKFESRPTRDIDFMIRWISNEVPGIERVMTEICEVDTDNDFITLEMLGSERITVEKEYPGVKTKFWAYIKNVRVPFSIDVGVDDIIVPGAVRRVVCTRLEGFKAPEVYTYSLESTIAEKFDAILKRMDATSRMKDFFDICYLSNMFDFDGRKVQEAISCTLEHRRTPYEVDSFEKIKVFKSNEFLRKLWGNYKSTLQGEIPEFDDIIDQLTRFLEPVFMAIVKEDEFFLQWYSGHNAWEKASQEKSERTLKHFTDQT